jgi:hypothetical protein
MSGQGQGERRIEIDCLSRFAAFLQFGLKSAARPIAAELETLGFLRLGVMRETASDGLVVLALVLAGVEHRAWADIFRTRDGVAHLYLYTPFAGGEVVLTGHYAREPVLTERAMVSGVPGAPLGNLLALHKAAVAKMERRSAPLPIALDPRLRIDAAYRWYENSDVNDIGLVPRRKR